MTFYFYIPTTGMKYDDIQILLSSFNKIKSQIKNSGSSHCKVIFDFSYCYFFISELSGLLYIMKIQLERMSHNVEFKNQSIGLQMVLLKNHFFDKIYHPDTHSTVIPLYHGDSKNSDKIFKYLHENVFANKNWPQKMNTDYEIESINGAISELALNIFQHSKSRFIYMCGQFYPLKKELSFTILDEGEGIPYNLINNLPFLKLKKDYELIDWATKRGNSTKIDAASGLGLFTIKKDLRDSGEMTIISNKGFWNMNDKGNIHGKILSYPLDGTLVHLKFSFNKTNFNAPKSELPYNENDRIFF